MDDNEAARFRALGTATHGDVSVSEARRLGEEMLVTRTRRRRAAA